MATRKRKGVSFSLGKDLGPRIKRQFTNLDPKDPSLWPEIPRYLLLLVVAGAVAAALWFSLIQDYEEDLLREQAQETALREDYTKKMAKAVSLDLLKKQREQIQQYVIQLEKQLPSKAEMAALLSDINQAGLGRSLQFELFKPSSVALKQYYAELPIALRVTGRYHDIGAFTADVAHLSRIVTLDTISIAPTKNADTLTMSATARTYRYLDGDEVKQQAAANNKGNKGNQRNQKGGRK